jgi:transcription antitermination factor NusG
MINESKWYAVYTKPRWEKKVADLLTRKQIENYCPLNKVKRQWSDRKKIVMEPLFQSYVFVRVPKNLLTMVRETSGVLNFVYWLQKPAIIRDEEIDLIKRYMNEYQNVHIQKATVNINDKVRVLSGPLMMREGNILEIKHKTVKVLLPSLGYTLVAEIEKGNLEKITLLNDQNAAYAS